MKTIFLAGLAFSGFLVFGQEQTTAVPVDRGGKTAPVEFQKDPRQTRNEETTKIVENGKGTPAASQKGSVNVDEDLRQRVLVSLSTGSVGTQGVLATNQLTDIKVAVTNRVVTLKGDVLNEKNKTTIGKRVAGLDGVTRVDNQLTINPGAKTKKDDALKPDGYSPGKNDKPTQPQVK